MRKMLLVALLAGAAAPAIAAPAETPVPRDQARSERAQKAERAPARAERAQPRIQRSQSPQARVEHVAQGQAPVARSERGQQRVQRTGRVAPVERVERTGESQRPRLAGKRQVEPPRRDSGEPAPRLRVQRAPIQGDSVRNWRARERQRADSPSSIQERNLRRAPGIDRSGEGLVEQTRALPPVLDRNRPRVISTRPKPGAEPPEPAGARLAHARPSRHWRTDWRRDHRYDWRNHRHRHRSLFRLGFYIDPFGWGYHRYGIGWRLWPSHYSNRYWIHDPWSYRLPRSYGPYRWIRYWDDALLVNLYTGEVVDVVHNFFW